MRLTVLKGRSGGAWPRRTLRMQLLAVLIGAGVACGAHAQADMDALIKAAKAEGEVTFYTSFIENVARRIINGFGAKYGIKPQFVRTNGSTLLYQRYATEAEAGNIAADLAFSSGGADAFAEAAIVKGWMDPVSKWELPVVKSGEFPARFNRGTTVVVQVSPYQIGYNTEKVKAADLPRDWMDLADPKWKGQLLVASPAISDAYVIFWGALLDKYGESFFARLRQNIRPISGGLAGMQGLAAGEGTFIVPAIISTVESVKEKGAPLSIFGFDYTTGVDMQLMLSARGKAKHPAAARLLANYVMSPEGNKVMNDEPGGLTVYESSKLPKEYQQEKPGTAARRPAMVKLLGF